MRQPNPDGQHVVLLTSLDLASVRLPFYLFWKRPYYRKYESRLENAFRQFFESRGYPVDILADATQADLWEALHSPRNVAVFWLSHAAGAQGSNPGLSSAGTIADVDGFDVTPAFQSIHPNLRYLGVVGCDSEDALFRQLSKFHVLEDHPLLEVRAFNKKVDAQWGLGKLIEVAELVIATPEVTRGYSSACEVRQGFPLKVIRRAPKKAPYVPAARLERNGAVLGIFPIARPGEAQTMTVYLELPPGPVSPFELKLVEDAGQHPGVMSKEVAIGELELGAPWPGARWEVFANRAGRPVGVTSRIYRYKGAAVTVSESNEAMPGEAAPIDFRPFECAPMPVR